MKATINEPSVEYDVTFWDGLEYDERNKTGAVGVVLTTPVDEKNRGLIYGANGVTYTLWPGDAIIKHIVDGKVALVTGMNRDEAIAKFNLPAELVAEELPSSEVTLLPADGDGERVDL